MCFTGDSFSLFPKEIAGVSQKRAQGYQYQIKYDNRASLTTHPRMKTNSSAGSTRIRVYKITMEANLAPTTIPYRHWRIAPRLFFRFHVTTIILQIASRWSEVVELFEWHACAYPFNTLRDQVKYLFQSTCSFHQPPSSYALLVCWVTRISTWLYDAACDLFVLTAVLRLALCNSGC